MSIRFGVSIPPCDHAARVAEAVQRAEYLGFDAAWIPDVQLLWRDCFVAMALAADRTTSITIGAGVSNTDTRHPSVVASAANTLREMAPERVILGLGFAAGIGQLINMASPTRSSVRDDVGQIRTLLDGEWWDYDDRRARLIGAGGRVPIYIAAGGPKQTELAGEIADGVILSVGTTPSVVERSIDQLAPGLKKSGRSLADIQVVCMAYLLVTDDPERDARRFKPLCGLLAKGVGAGVFREAGLDIGDLSELPPVYPAISYAEDWDEAMRLASTVISDAAALLFAQKFALCGTVTEIVRQVRAMGGVGVDQIFIRPIESYTLPYDAMESFGAVMAQVAIGD